jgi:hypothetical protein
VTWKEFDFDAEVDKRVSQELPREALARAKAFHVQQGKTRSQGDVTECIELAGAFAEVIGGNKDSAKEESLHQRLTPHTTDMEAQSAERARAIFSRVQQVRQQLFGTEQPPFGSQADAERWLEEEATRQVRSDEIASLRTEIQGMMGKWARLTGGHLGFGLNVLPFARQDRIDKITIKSPGALAVLETETRRMANATGFSQPSVVAYVLTDVTPILAPYTVSLSVPLLNEFDVLHIPIIITYNKRDITDTEIREMRREIRQLWNSEKEKRLGDHALILRDIVEECGPEPEKGKMAYWQRIKQEFNRRTGGNRYGSGKAAKKAYTAIRRKAQGDGGPTDWFQRNFHRLWGHFHRSAS